ncbi:hypothetical protein ACFL08_00875 [Patescibacteria group bacterium]
MKEMKDAILRDLCNVKMYATGLCLTLVIDLFFYAVVFTSMTVNIESSRFGLLGLLILFIWTFVWIWGLILLHLLEKLLFILNNLVAFIFIFIYAIITEAQTYLLSMCGVDITHDNMYFLTIFAYSILLCLYIFKMSGKASLEEEVD